MKKSLFEDELPFDDSPSEDDDDDDDAVDQEDPAKEEIEVISDPKMNWSTPTYTSPWAGPVQQQNTSNNNNSNNPFSNSRSSDWTRSSSTTTTSSFFSPQNQTKQSEILPRSKKIIVCDFLDNIVENYQGCPGVEPRGVYDLRPKFDFWYKLKYINPDYIIVCTNQNFTLGTKQSGVFNNMVGYFMNALAEFIKIPYENCFCYCKTGYDKTDFRVKPNPGLVVDALNNIHWTEKGYKKEDVLIVGYNSGYPGQSDVDMQMAKRLGMDYIDIPQLIDKYV